MTLPAIKEIKQCACSGRGNSEVIENDEDAELGSGKHRSGPFEVPMREHQHERSGRRARPLSSTSMSSGYSSSGSPVTTGTSLEPILTVGK